MGDQINIIGLSGKLRSGKTWLANQLCQRYGMAPLSFATPLKEDVMSMGFSYIDVYVEKAEPVRRLLQVYGQAQRYKDPDYWLRKGMAQIEKIRDLHPGVVVVFDDVRFPNEADAIRERNGIVIRCERGDYTRDYDSSHDVSETALDAYDFDATIEAASGDTAGLLTQAQAVLVARGVIPWDSTI